MKLLARVLPPLTRAAVDSYLMSKREKIVEKQARARQEALETVSGVETQDTAPDEPGGQGQSVDLPPPEPDRGRDPAADLESIIEQETCSTCKMALAEAQDLPLAEQERVVDVYETKFKPAKAQYADGEIDKATYEAALDELLDATGL